MDQEYRNNEYYKYGTILNEMVYQFNDMLTTKWKVKLPFTTANEFQNIVYRFEDIPRDTIEFDEFDARGVYFIFGYNEQIQSCSLYGASGFRVGQQIKAPGGNIDRPPL